MKLAFATGALSTALVAGGLTGLLIWVVTVVTGSTDPWSVAPWLVTLVAAVVAAATYVVEGIAYRRSLARMRSTGEPWAFRQDG